MSLRTHNSIIRTLHIDQGGIVAFVGAGGKTTLMLKMAAELSLIDKDILITTTTKIMSPGKELASHLIVADSPGALLHKADSILKQSNCVVAASRQCSDTGKLVGFGPGFIDDAWKSGRFRWILVEADGSARKPIKAPAAHEPVIPKETRYLFGLIGLSALGKPLSDAHVHRLEHFKRITGLGEGERIDVSALAALIQHPNGLFKDCPPHAKTFAFLNQADSLSNIDLGKSISKHISRSKAFVPDLLAIGQVRELVPVLHVCSKCCSTETCR